MHEHRFVLAQIVLVLSNYKLGAAVFGAAQVALLCVMYTETMLASQVVSAHGDRFLIDFNASGANDFLGPHGGDVQVLDRGNGTADNVAVHFVACGNSAVAIFKVASVGAVVDNLGGGADLEHLVGVHGGTLVAVSLLAASSVGLVRRSRR